MKASLIDRSNYYRGLLVLSARDRVIGASERELMLQIGKMLDFEERFCEAAIDSLIRNAHLTKEPITFSDRMIAECFFHDALRLALVDGELHPMELRWLRKVAHANGFTDIQIDALIRKSRETGAALDPSAPLRIQQYL
jgi:hypothetical protein